MSFDTQTFNSKKYGQITVSYKRTSDAIIFHTNVNITSDESGIIQAHLGYAPQGYHHYDYKSNINGTSWKCWTSCS